MSDALVHEGGCVCGDVRYRTIAKPLQVIICHCTFCQRLTGSAYLVEPIFRKKDVVFSGVALKTYQHRSDESGKSVAVNFCGRCGTNIYLEMERFAGIFGLFGGTFDDPNWFDRSGPNSQHIFTSSAQTGVVLPAGAHTFSKHAFTADGEPNPPVVLAHALEIPGKT